MMLPALLLSAVLSPAPQQPSPAPPAEPLKTTKAEPVKAESLPAASSASAQAATDAGLLAFKKRRYLQAEIEFRKAMEADPTSAGAAFYLGYTYYKMAEPKRPFHPDKQKAAAMFAKAFELDPQFKPVWATKATKKKG